MSYSVGLHDIESVVGYRCCMHWWTISVLNLVTLLWLPVCIIVFSLSVFYLLK